MKNNNKNLLKMLSITVAFCCLVSMNGNLNGKLNLATGASNKECKIELQFKVGDKSFTKNGQPQPAMDAMPEMKSNRMFLMIRYVAESVGAKVEWLADTKNCKNYQTRRPSH